MTTSTANSESRDNATIAILEMIVIAALVLSLVFLMLGNATDSITVISSSHGTLTPPLAAAE